MRKFLVFALIIGLLYFLSMCSGSKDEGGSGGSGAESSELSSSSKPQPFKPYTIEDSSKIDTLPSGLMIYIVEKGSGKVPQAGETVIVNYHGMLPDGSVFDSSFERGQPFVLQVGVGQVIKGWD